MKYKKNIIVIVLTLGFFSFTMVKNDYFEMTKQIEIFVTLYKKLNTNYVDKLSPLKLMNKAISNMLKEIDPYTVFYNEQDIEYSRMRHSSGVGVGAKFEYRDKKLIISDISKGRSADRSGLRLGDEISHVKNISVADFGMNALELLKGKKGTQIQITYKRGSKVKTTSLTIDNLFDDVVPFYDIIDGEVGYIILKEFGKNTSSQIRAAFEGLKIRGAKSLIIDLRGNPGGLLQEAIKVVGLFVPKGQLVVSTRSKIEKYNRLFQTKSNPVDLNIPIAILIDGHSASASEIVSGTFQDIDRAVVVGSRSFGKGLVQSIMPLVYGNQLKVTISRYYTPSGRCIQALDYSHKDKKGKAKRNTKNDYSRFTTKNGRLVFDGGGIMPDVSFPSPFDNVFLKTLIDNRKFFDFSTKYVNENLSTDIEKFKISTTIFKDFKDFSASDLKYVDSNFEDYLKNKLEEDFPKNDEVKEQTKRLLQTLETSKYSSFDKYQHEIKQLLHKEILRHYMYQKEMYKYSLSHDRVIQKAKNILQSPKVYQALLQP